MEREEYLKYLASREWAVLREQVRERCDDACERCGSAPMRACHHLTYERIGEEKLEDLQGLCEACHKFASGKTKEDPALSDPCQLRTYADIGMELAGEDEGEQNETGWGLTGQDVSKLSEAQRVTCLLAATYRCIGSANSCLSEMHGLLINAGLTLSRIEQQGMTNREGVRK